MNKAYNIQTEKSENIKEGSKLKLNLDIFNTINPVPKATNLLEKKSNEQAQTQPVFQNKLANDLNNKLGANILRNNANQTPNEKPTRFFDEKNTIDNKTQNLTSEISALDKILLANKSNYKTSNVTINHNNKNNDGDYLSKLREVNSGTIPILNSASKGIQNKNKIQEIKTDNNIDAYLQLKLNSNTTAKARNILPSQETTKSKANEHKEIKKEPLKIEKTPNFKPNTNNFQPNQNNTTTNKQPHNSNIKVEEKNNEKLPNIIEDNVEEKLYECTEGCGRKFNAKALEKHAKICKKVFQSKPQKVETETKKKPDNKKEKENLTKKGKWQKQSEAFRAVVKAVKNQFGSEEEKKKTEKKENKKKEKK